MNTISKLLIATLFVFSAVQAKAQKNVFEAQTFSDQHEAEIALTNETKYLIFTGNKDASEQVRVAFAEQNLEDLSDKGILYVADVSAMPSFITKMFALPKMRDYPFKMAVIMDEEQIKDWPKQEEKITAIRLENLHVQSLEYLDTAQDVSSWLAQP